MSAVHKISMTNLNMLEPMNLTSEENTCTMSILDSNSVQLAYTVYLQHKVVFNTVSVLSSAVV